MIRKYKNKVFIFLGISAFIYILIWLWFSFDGFIPNGNDLDKSDWLGFLSGFLSFIGTISLGILALIQNERLSKVNLSYAENQTRPLLTAIVLNSEYLKPSNAITHVEITVNNDELSSRWSNQPNKKINNPYIIFSLRNIGGGPLTRANMFLYKAVSVDGKTDFSNEEIYNDDRFYENLLYQEYENVATSKVDKYAIVTEFDLGVSESNSQEYFTIIFDECKTNVHSVIKIEYESVLGNRYYQLLFIALDNSKAFMCKISRPFPTKTLYGDAT